MHQILSVIEILVKCGINSKTLAKLSASFCSAKAHVHIILLLLEAGDGVCDSCCDGLSSNAENRNGQNDCD